MQATSPRFAAAVDFEKLFNTINIDIISQTAHYMESIFEFTEPIRRSKGAWRLPPEEGSRPATRPFNLGTSF